MSFQCLEGLINFLNRNDFVQQLMSMFSCSLAKVSHAITMVDLWISGMENGCYHSLVALRRRLAFLGTKRLSWCSNSALDTDYFCDRRKTEWDMESFTYLDDLFQ